MQRLEVSGEVRPIYGSLGVKRLMFTCTLFLSFICSLLVAEDFFFFFWNQTLAEVVIRSILIYFDI